MIIHCPICQSTRVITRDIARKTCGILGMLGGAAGMSSGSLAGAELGATFGLIAGPPGAIIGGTAGALLGFIVACATAGAAGAKLGEVIDERILDNCQCLNCGYQFSQKADQRPDI